LRNAYTVPSTTIVFKPLWARATLANNRDSPKTTMTKISISKGVLILKTLTRTRYQVFIHVGLYPDGLNELGLIFRPHVSISSVVEYSSISTL
jgi:hypothetical protein